MRISDTPDDEVTINKDRKPRPSFAGISVLPSPLARMFDNGTPAGMQPAAGSRGDLTALASRLRRVHIDPAGGQMEGGPARALAFDDDDEEDADKENGPRNPFLFPNEHSKADLDRPMPLAGRSPNVAVPAVSPPAKTPLADEVRTPEAREESPAAALPVPSLQMENVPEEATGAPATFSARGAPMDFTPAARTPPPVSPSADPAPSPMNISETPMAVRDVVGESLSVVMQGANEHSWQSRCAALFSLRVEMEDAPSAETTSKIRAVMDQLTDALISHLGESRPSVIRGALGLIEALVDTGMAKGTAMPERVFDEVLDLVCGQSLTAEDAAVTLSVLLANFGQLKGMLKNADNPDRLLALLSPTVEMKKYSAEQKQTLTEAVVAVVEVMTGGGETGEAAAEMTPTPLEADKDGDMMPVPSPITLATHPSLAEPENGGDVPSAPAAISKEDEKSAVAATSQDAASAIDANKGAAPVESAPSAIAEAMDLALNEVKKRDAALEESALAAEEKAVKEIDVKQPQEDVVEEAAPAAKINQPAPAASSTATSEDRESKVIDSASEPVSREGSGESSSSIQSAPKLASKPPLPGNASASSSDSVHSTRSLENAATAAASAFLPRNKRLSSARRLSPTALRKVKRYTTEDIEEAKREATEAAEAAFAERAAMEREKLERALSAERKDKEELHTVLGEFEKTMSTMAADKRSSVSAPMHAMLDVEVNRLKTELFETSEAFTNLKTRYADAKETIAVLQGKEDRVVEQNHELRQSLIELQKWSNDLKANTEKKLAKSFEAVSEYRTTSLDRQAHADKAISELALVNRDLESQKAFSAETTQRLAETEAKLHDVQDLAASLQAALDEAKTSVAELTADRNGMREEADASRLSLARMQDEFDRLKEAEAKASEAVLKTASLEVENRSLKANAYDQMTRGRALEKKLAGKEKECEELNSICEELLSNMEKDKQPAV